MRTDADKLKIVQSLDEAAFRGELLVPLLRQMGCAKVRERHGSQEYGKDITFCEASQLGDTYTAVVAKVGDISGAASGKSNLAGVETQISMAFDMPILDVEDKQEHDVDRVIVWTTGRISGNAEQLIQRGKAGKYRNVRFKDGRATLELLEQFYPAFFSIRDPHISDYFSAAKKCYSEIEELYALGLSPQRHLLPSMFVPPRLTAYMGRQVSGRLGRTPQTGARVEAPKTLSFEEFVSKRQSTVVVGQAGSGKTTLLRRMLLHVIEENEGVGRRTPIPLLLELKRIDFGAVDGLVRALVSEFVRLSPECDASELQRELVGGGVLVLLDGLDELQGEARVALAMERVEAFVQAYPMVRIVLTSRLLDLFEKPGAFPSFEVFQLSDLSPGEMISFVKQWCGEDSSLGQRLVALLQNPQFLGGLPRTPFTLALVTALYEEGTKEIPANQTELYQKYVELALARWDVSKDLSLQFEWRVKEFMLRKVGWLLQEGRRFEIGRDEFVREVERLGLERGLPVIGSALMEEVTERSELLVESGEGNYEFKHRSFQEYFAGMELAGRADCVSFAVEKILDPWWWQVTFFAVGLRPDNDDCIRAIIEAVSRPGYQSVPVAAQLGVLAQAAYLAPKSTKVQAVERILDMFLGGWDESAEALDALGSSADLKRFPGHFFRLMLFTALATYALGSITLRSVLEEAVAGWLAQDGDGMSPRKRAERQLRVFFLATACAQCDDVRAFFRVLESGVLTDPDLMLFLAAQAATLNSRAWIASDDRTNAAEWERKLQQKVRKNSEYLRALLLSRPLRLPAPDSEDAEPRSS